MDPRRLSSEFDSRVRATQKQIPDNHGGFLRSAGWSTLWWLLAVVLVAAVLAVVVAAYIAYRG